MFHWVDEEHVTCWFYHSPPMGGPIKPETHLGTTLLGCHLGPRNHVVKPRAQKCSTKWMRNM